jgi:site-specific recombinase XerD
MRHKGVPTIETLAATKRSPERYRVRWDRGRKSFTDSSKTEVMRFAVDLVENGYEDLRTLGKVYRKAVRQAKQRPTSRATEHTFRTVANLYLENIDVTPGVLRNYRNNLKKHAFPLFGDKHINDVEIEHIEKVGRSLSSTTRSSLISGQLTPIFEYAIVREWRERANPCRAVTKLISRRPVIQPILELTDAPMFLECCYEVSGLIGDFTSLMYGKGFRWQEASTLTVGAVNLKRRTIRISQVERRDGGATIATDRGKSDSAFRDAPLPRRDDDPLNIILRNRTENRDPGEWLFTARRGGRIYHNLLQDGLNRALEIAWDAHRYDVHITAHAFRRGYAQALQDRGATADQIKRLLGHLRLTGATRRYAFDRLTETQIAELQPFIADLVWRSRDGQEAERRFRQLRPVG